jgi:isopenicillin N synthase-like dioxygenase
MNSLNTNTEFSLEELKKESVMGVMGTETQREVRIIDLSDFENRKYEIADQLWNAAVEIGFFKLPITAFRKKRFSTHLVWQNNFLLCHAKLKHNILSIVMQVGKARHKFVHLLKRQIKKNLIKSRVPA